MPWSSFVLRGLRVFVFACVVVCLFVERNEGRKELIRSSGSEWNLEYLNLVIRIDGKMEWNWFCFVWLDVLLVYVLVFYMYFRCFVPMNIFGRNTAAQSRV